MEDGHEIKLKLPPLVVCSCSPLKTKKWIEHCCTCPYKTPQPVWKKGYKSKVWERHYVQLCNWLFNVAVRLRLHYMVLHHTMYLFHHSTFVAEDTSFSENRVVQMAARLAACLWITMKLSDDFENDFYVSSKEMAFLGGQFFLTGSKVRIEERRVINALKGNMGTLVLYKSDWDKMLISIKDLQVRTMTFAYFVTTLYSFRPEISGASKPFSFRKETVFVACFLLARRTVKKVRQTRRSDASHYFRIGCSEDFWALNMYIKDYEDVLLSADNYAETQCNLFMPIPEENVQ